MYDLYPQNWNDEGSRLATERVEADRTPRRRAKVSVAASPFDTRTSSLGNASPEQPIRRE